MNSILPRLVALAVMVLVIGAAHELRVAGFEHPELDALGAAGVAAILTAVVRS